MTAKGKRGIHGVPHWKVEAEMRGRTELTRAGIQTALGAAKLNLMFVFATAARNGSPYLEEETHDILKTTLIVLELRNRVTGELYAEDSDIRSLVAGFLERCKLRASCSTGGPGGNSACSAGCVPVGRCSTGTASRWHRRLCVTTS